MVQNEQSLFERRTERDVHDYEALPFLRSMLLFKTRWLSLSVAVGYHIRDMCTEYITVISLRLLMSFCNNGNLLITVTCHCNYHFPN